MRHTIERYAHRVLPSVSTEIKKYRIGITSKMNERIEEYSGGDTYQEFVMKAIDLLLFIDSVPYQLSLLSNNEVKVAGKPVGTSLDNYVSSKTNKLKPTNLSMPTWKADIANLHADQFDLNLTDYVRKAIELRIEAFKIVTEIQAVSPTLVLALPIEVGEKKYLFIT